MSTPGHSGDWSLPSQPPASNRSMWITGAAVLALHAAVIAAITLWRSPEPVKVATPPVVMATLISPQPAPVPVPTRPEPPKPVEKPKPQVHKTAVVKRPTLRPLPTTTSAPTPIAAAEPTPPAPPAPPQPAAPPAPPAPPPAPAVNPNIPKNVKHLTCAATQPEYPALSRRRGETGTAVVQFVVDTTGRVESAHIKSSSGFSRLDDAALAAALASPCTPYMEGGQAVKALTERPYSFSLSQ